MNSRANSQANNRVGNRASGGNSNRTMLILSRILIVLLLLLQYRLWLGEDSQRSLYALHRAIDAQRASNAEAQQRNSHLQIEVLDLKTGLEAVEERARSELGMIGEDETFYLIVNESAPDETAP